MKNNLKKRLKVFSVLENLITSARNMLPPPSISHKTYGKIYLPYYNLNLPLNNHYPDIYNSEGKKWSYFLSEMYMVHI